MYSDEQVWRVLDGLLVGTHQRMESVGDWADRLDTEPPNPLVTRFINQLDDEWYDVEPPDSFCAELAGRVQKRLAAGGTTWPNLWAHILRVTGIGLALAEETNTDPVAVYALCLCHDVAKLDEDRIGEAHEDLGAAFAGQALKGHLRPALIEAIQAAILREDDGDLGRLLHDADKLDKIGAAGIVRRLSAETEREGVSDELWRVSHDARYFPAMHFDLSREIAAHKRVFQAWFVMLAERVLDE